MTTGSEASPSIPPLFAKLAKILSGDLDGSYACLKAHSSDGSPYSLRPQVVIYPKNTSDIKHVISFAQEYQIPIAPCGGMKASSGGALCEGIIIDMSRYFSHIKNMNVMENTVTVDAGVTIDELINKLASWNMELPVLESEHSYATIGGLVATKSATSKTFHSGSIREWIEGITCVVDSGEEHHLKDGTSPSGRLLGIYQSVFPLLSENSSTLRASRRESSDDATGYSLWNMSIGPRQLMDQIVGSEGTLAVITSITFRIVQKKKHSISILIPVHNIALLESCIAIAKHHLAERLYMFDETFRKFTDSYHPGLLEERLPVTFCTLLVTLKDNDLEVLSKRIHMLLKAVPGDNSLYTINEDTASRIITEEFLHSLFQNYFKGTHMLATSAEGIIVLPSVYSDCIESLDDTLGLSGRMYTITGFAGSGHIAVTSAFDTRSLSYEHDLNTYREDMFTIVRKYKGGISAVGGDGLERTSSLSYVYNEAARTLFKEIKACWDPQAIFNPSKKQYISKEYLTQHTLHSLE